MQKYVCFVLPLLLLGSLAQGQSDITQWGGTITTNTPMAYGSPSDLIVPNNGNLDYWTPSGTVTLGFQAVKSVVLSAYALGCGQYNTYGPTNWTLSGSNDGASWTILDTQTGQSFGSSSPQTYPLTANTTAFSYYQLSFTAFSTPGFLVLSQWQLFTLAPPPPPPAPVLNGNAISGTEANLTWTDSPGLTDSLYVERSTNGTNFSPVALPMTPGVLSYYDQTLTPSTTYYYRVRAKNGSGSTYSNVVQFKTSNLTGQSTDITTDGGSLSASADNVGTGEVATNLIDHNISTKWLVFAAQDPSGQLSAVYKPTGSYIVTGYGLTTANDNPPRDPGSWSFSASNDSVHWITLDTEANQLGNNAARLTNFNYFLSNPGTTAYKYYQITFTADNGASDGVAYQVGEWEIYGVDALSPAIPSGLTVTDSTVTSLTLSWSEAAGNPVDNFRLQRSTDGFTFATIDTLGAGLTSFVDKNLYDSTRYYYRLQALGSRSTAVSGWSDVASASTTFTPGLPLIPGQLTTAFVIDSVVGLQWVNRAYDATGIQIERSVDGINFIPIDSVSMGATTFNDSTVWPAFPYYYRVTAFNTQGSAAGYSNVDTVITTGFNDPPILTQINPPQNVCSNSAVYRFNLSGLTGGTIGTESTQQLTVTNITTDTVSAGFFSNLSFTPAVSNGVATFTVQGSGTAKYGDTATVIITVMDNGGTLNSGTDSATFSLQLVYTPFTVSISADKDTVNVPRYTIVHLTASTNYASTTPNYAWDNVPGIEGSLDNIILNAEPLAPTTYTVHATTTAGCTASAQINLVPIQGQLISNVITPNGDGINDTWIIWGISQYPNNTVKVFDRSGHLVYTKTGYTNDWNGTIDGRPLDEGAYYYIVDYGDGQKPVSGMLTIVRDHQ